MKRLLALDAHDGFRVDINKQLSPYMLVVHSFWLGTGMLPEGRNKSYSFVTQVADESGGLMMARVDPERGSDEGRLHRVLFGGLAMGKLQVSVSAGGGEASSNDSLMGEVDVGAGTWTANLKYGSMGGGIVMGCNYFQSITPNLSMGGEGLYLAANQSLLSNYAVKYTMAAKTGDDLADANLPSLPNETTGSSTFFANYNSAQNVFSLAYRRLVTPPSRVQMGAELQCSPVTLESQVTLGAEFKLERSKVSVCVDGGGKIQTVVEAKLAKQQGSPTMNFSGELDHWNNVMRFGYGINIEG